MAQSRPPPSRTHPASSNSVSSPPPSHHEKRHHSRRKSGKTEHSSSTTTSEKRLSGMRPAPQSRKTTPQYVSKVGSLTRPREREESERSDDRARDSGESFPQFCMSCEKQFLPPNNTYLYCSESCRVHDLNPPSGPSRTSSYPGTYNNNTPPLTPYGLHFPTSHEDGPDIIPRFSPTQSRPRSYFSSEPHPSSYQSPSAISASVPHHQQYNGYTDSGDEKRSPYASRRTGESSSALESLREIAGALPKVSSSTASNAQKERKGSRDSINNNDNSSSGSGVWGYIPFTSSSSAANTPGNSYTQPSPYNVSHSQSYGREDVQSYSYGNHGAVAYSTVSYISTGGMGMDRPLPPRSGPGGYGHRPKSIDLVTPFSSGY